MLKARIETKRIVKTTSTMSVVGQRIDGRPLSPADAYDAAAENYDKWHWQKIWRFVEHDIIDNAIESEGAYLRVLDIGCGTGTLLFDICHSRYDEIELTGVDISKGMLERAVRKCSGQRVNFLHANFLDADFEQKHFDIIFMLRVASHMENLNTCFDKVSSILGSGGRFIFSDVCSLHSYDCTRLPAHGAKLPVATYKHKLSEIVRAAYKHKLIPQQIRAFSAKDLPNNIKSDPDIPHVLLDQLIRGRAIPFGCTITFSSST